jgi:hypothetical protein
MVDCNTKQCLPGRTGLLQLQNLQPTKNSINDEANKTIGLPDEPQTLVLVLHQNLLEKYIRKIKKDGIVLVELKDGVPNMGVSLA